MDNKNQINWAEQYILKLSHDMDEMRGMEARLNNKIDSMTKHVQTLIVAMFLGLAAIIIAVR